MIEGVTHKPTIVKDDESGYVIVGSVDHGMEIPVEAIPELVSSLEGVEALMMEAPKILHPHMHPMSTEIITLVSVGRSPVHYLPGTRLDEEIGELVLKYAPQDIAEVYIPCLYVRNTNNLGQSTSLEAAKTFITKYMERFGFLDMDRALELYRQVFQYWVAQGFDPEELDHFSYDFEKFVGDVIEYELWRPKLFEFEDEHIDKKVAACVGDYHVPFVQAIFDGEPTNIPDWDTHVYTRREDRHTPQDNQFLERIYSNLEKALRE